MNDKPQGDIVTTHHKATLLATFTSLLVAIAEQIKNDDYKKIAIPLAPFIVLLLSIVFKTLYKKYKCNRLIKIHENWIISLETELASPAATQIRKKEILKEITGYQAEIKKLQKESVEIEFN